MKILISFFAINLSLLVIAQQEYFSEPIKIDRSFDRFEPYLIKSENVYFLFNIKKDKLVSDVLDQELNPTSRFEIDLPKEIEKPSLIFIENNLTYLVKVSNGKIITYSCNLDEKSISKVSSLQLPNSEIFGDREWKYKRNSDGSYFFIGNNGIPLTTAPNGTPSSYVKWEIEVFSLNKDLTELNFAYSIDEPKGFESKGKKIFNAVKINCRAENAFTIDYTYAMLKPKERIYFESYIQCTKNGSEIKCTYKEPNSDNPTTRKKGKPYFFRLKNSEDIRFLLPIFPSDVDPVLNLTEWNEKGELVSTYILDLTLEGFDFKKGFYPTVSIFENETSLKLLIQLSGGRKAGTYRVTTLFDEANFLDTEFQDKDHESFYPFFEDQIIFDDKILFQHDLALIMDDQLIYMDKKEIFEKVLGSSDLFHFVIDNEIISVHSNYVVGNLNSEIIKWKLN